MNENVFIQEQKKEPEVNFATIDEIYSDGVTLIFDGETEPTTKHYKCNSAVVFSAGDRVKVLRDSGTYVVEYPVGNPLIKALGISSLSSSATLAQLLTEWGQLIAAIDGRGYKWIE